MEFKDFKQPMICKIYRKCKYPYKIGCHGMVHEYKHESCDEGQCDGDSGIDHSQTCRKATEADFILEGF